MHSLKKLAIIAVAGIFSCSGCRTPKHTDLLIFGTNTQFGISVAADATSNPSINVGYKRQEVVLMPLYVNAQESKYPPSEAKADAGLIAAAKYTGTDGAVPWRSDTYSVLAVFGATGEGNAEGTTGKAKIGIAQYFATGLAARTLAIAGGALINTSDNAADASKATAMAASAAFSIKPEIVHGLAPLNAAYWDASEDQKKLYTTAVNKVGYPDIGHFFSQEPPPSSDQISAVRTDLEADPGLKALIDKYTPKK